MIPPSEFGDVEVWLDFSPDWTVLAYAMLLAVVATLLFTMGPALRRWRWICCPSSKRASNPWSAASRGCRRRSRVSTSLATFHVRAAGSPATLLPSLMPVLREAAPDVPVLQLRTMTAELHDMAWMARTLTVMLMLFAGGSLLIATLGQYAAMAFAVSRRVREAGLRIALGATPGRMFAAALGEGLGLTALGLVLGGTPARRPPAPRQPPVRRLTRRPVGARGVVIVLGAASLTACALPARRLARIDPVHALRHE